MQPGLIGAYMQILGSRIDGKIVRVGDEHTIGDCG